MLTIRRGNGVSKPFFERGGSRRHRPEINLMVSFMPRIVAQCLMYWPAVKHDTTGRQRAGNGPVARSHDHHEIKALIEAKFADIAIDAYSAFKASLGG